MKISLALSALFLAAASFLRADIWTIDPVHSSVGFSIRHFFSPVPGNFTEFSGQINYDADNVEKSSANATIKVSSVDTRNDKRNEHLLGADFFKATDWPDMTFESTSWKKTGENTFDVTGKLTIKDITKEVVLKTKLLGSGPGMGGKTVSGWEATTTLDRTDFGLSYGQGIVGNEVEVTINIEASK